MYFFAFLKLFNTSVNITHPAISASGITFPVVFWEDTYRMLLRCFGKIHIECCYVVFGRYISNAVTLFWEDTYRMLLRRAFFNQDLPCTIALPMTMSTEEDLMGTLSSFKHAKCLVQHSCFSEILVSLLEKSVSCSTSSMLNNSC